VTRSDPLTLMAVHAHPDDEASSTGGVLARCAAEGIRTVLVTCTRGEFGDGPGGVKPGEEGHDEAAVVALRARELAESCRILGVTVAEQLGYHDSGMMGWPQNEAPGVFWQMSVDEAAAPLAALLARYRPQVVVTYDDNGFYGHPDHIQAHRITRTAIALTGDVVEKLYYPAIPYSVLGRFAEALQEAGIEMPEQEEREEGVPPDFGVPDERIAATVDCSDFADAKFRALAAHGSQTDSSFFLRLKRETFDSMFGTERYVREFDRTGSTVPEDDLFAGLR